MSERKEYAAFHFTKDIVYLAYYQTGGKKEDTAYTEGWKLEKKGSERYPELRRVLDARFGFDQNNPYLTNEKGQLVGIGSPFIGCHQVFLDKAIPADIKTVLLSWFLESGVDCLEVVTPKQSIHTINTKWEKPMGEPFPANSGPEDIGQARALGVMEIGLKQLTEVVK